MELLTVEGSYHSLPYINRSNPNLLAENHRNNNIVIDHLIPESNVLSCRKLFEAVGHTLKPKNEKKTWL